VAGVQKADLGHAPDYMGWGPQEYPQNGGHRRLRKLAWQLQSRLLEGDDYGKK